MEVGVAGKPDLELLTLDLEIVNRPVLTIRPAPLGNPDNLGVHEGEANHGDRTIT